MHINNKYSTKDAFGRDKPERNSIFVSFPDFCPKPGQAVASVKKEENGKDNFYLTGKIMEPWPHKNIDSQGEVQENDDPGKVS